MMEPCIDIQVSSNGDIKLCSNCRWENNKDKCPKFTPQYPNGGWTPYGKYDAMTDSSEGICQCHGWKAMPGDKPICELVSGHMNPPASCEACWKEWDTLLEIPPCCTDPNECSSEEYHSPQHRIKVERIHFPFLDKQKENSTKISSMEKNRQSTLLKYIIKLMDKYPVWQGTPTDLCLMLEALCTQDRCNHWWQTYITVRLKKLKEELVSAGIVYEKIYYKGQCIVLLKKVEPPVSNAFKIPMTMCIEKSNKASRCIRCSRSTPCLGLTS